MNRLAPDRGRGRLAHDRMKTYPVTPRMRSPSFNDLACIDP